MAIPTDPPPPTFLPPLPPTFADFASICSEATARFCNPSPVSEDEIEAMYKSLFETSLQTEASLHLETPGHIASVIFFLNDVIQNHRRDPTGTIFSTETSGCKGINGSYFLKSSSGKSLWVFKPRDEETYPLGIGIPRGGGTVREHFATIVNDDEIYPIPFTAHVILFGKEGSVQRVVPGRSLRVLLDESRSYVEDGEDAAAIAARASGVVTSISPRQFQAKLIFDLIFGNGDGHEGNIMCAPSSFYSIDHGNICSTSHEAVLCIPYVRLLKSTEPLAPDLLAYCRDLPIRKYRDLMRRFGFDEAAITYMEMRANWLMHALSRGLTIKESALPLALYGTSIYQKPDNLEKFIRDITSLRIQLHTLCSEENWEKLTALLTNLRGGRLTPTLVKGDDQFRQLWSMYLKPLLAEYPSSIFKAKEIGDEL
jgi:hypothetical protein